MNQIEELGDIGQKQPVRLTLDDDTTIEGQVSQSIYDPDENLRLEISARGTEEFGRYQVRAHVEDGEWTTPEVRGHETGASDWTDMGSIEAVTPLTGHRTNTEDMDDADAAE